MLYIQLLLRFFDKACLALSEQGPLNSFLLISKLIVMTDRYTGLIITLAYL